MCCLQELATKELTTRPCTHTQTLTIEATWVSFCSTTLTLTFQVLHPHHLSHTLTYTPGCLRDAVSLTPSLTSLAHIHALLLGPPLMCM